jgi:hypothetical protein
MVREDLFFAVVTFMSMLILVREMLAMIRRRHGRGGSRPA